MTWVLVGPTLALFVGFAGIALLVSCVVLAVLVFLWTMTTRH